MQEIGGTKKKSDKLQRIFAFSVMAGMALVAFWVTQNNDAIAAALYKSFAGSGNLPVGITLDSGGDVGQFTSIAQGADGFPVISYYDVTNGNLNFAKCNDIACSSVATSTLDSGGNVGKATSIAVGTDGFPVISYLDVTNNYLKFAKCNDASCSSPTIRTLDTTGITGWGSSIAIGRDGYPVISYDNIGSNFLRFVKCNDASCSSPTIRTLDSSGSVQAYTSIAIGKDGYPVISYLGGSSNLMFAKCNDASCSSPILSTLDTTSFVGYYLSMAIGLDGFPVVSYGDLIHNTLKFAKCNDASCSAPTIRTLDSSGSGEYTSIAIGLDGYPVISYHSGGTFHLKFTKCNDASCSAPTIRELDSTGDVGRDSSIAKGVDGYPVISYYDLTNTHLKFIHCNGYCGAVTHVNHSQNSVLTSGLVGEWSFNGDDMNWVTNKALDRSGQGNDGTLTNMSTTTSPVAGKIGQALLFDGVNDQINAGAGSSLGNLGPLTFSAWIKPRSMGGGSSGAIMGKTGTGYVIFQLANTNGLGFGKNYDTANDLEAYSNDNAVTMGIWQHVVATWDGTAVATNVHFYVNGVETSYQFPNDATGNRVSDVGKPLVVGSFYNGNSPFDGALDEVRVYNRVLTQAEITQLYQSGQATLNASQNNKNKDGLVGQWSFNGADMNWMQNKALDRSGNGNDGTLTNMSTTTSPVIGKIGQALNFDGTDDYVDTPLVNLGSSAGTVSWWQKPSTAYNTGTIRGIWGQTNGAAAPELSAQVFSDNNWYVGWNNPSDDDRVIVAATAPNYRQGQWDHYVFTWASGGDSTLYQNGAVLGNKVGGTTVSDLGGSHTLRIGKQGEVASWFPGTIDEVRVYNRVLPASEIQQLYNQGR